MLDTLSLLEAWLTELQRKHPLPESFDMEFFCKGIGILLDSDHHQTVLRVLQVIYSSSDLFNGSLRYMLFGELLIKKMFFTLFLHWDMYLLAVAISTNLFYTPRRAQCIPAAYYFQGCTN